MVVPQKRAQQRLILVMQINVPNNNVMELDLTEGKDVVALYFQNMPVIHRDEYLPPFVQAISEALPSSVEQEKLIILIFGYDIGGMVGRTLKKETNIEQNFLSLDELHLEEGDFIDIGAPLAEGHSFPITVKSLAFY